MAAIAEGVLRIKNVDDIARYHRAFNIISEACERYEFDETLKVAREELRLAAQSLTFHLRERGKKK